MLILADDLGYGDVGCYNAKSKIPTPRLDRFASQGMRFTDAHTPSSVCTPTRYGVLTGRFCWRSRLKSGVLWGFDHPLIETDRPTIASFLKSQGYATGGVGKWHLGLGWALKNGDRGPWPDRSRDKPHDGGWAIDYAAPLRDGPNALGFDYYFGIAASNNMPPYCFFENDHVVGSPNVVKHPLNYGNTKAPMVADWDNRQIGPTFAKQAVQFITRAHQRDPRSPFFLYLPYQAPHRPCTPPEMVQGKSQAGRRGDMVVELDWAVGQVLDTLQRLGLEDNTLIFITSDNGATPGDTFPPEAMQRNGNIYGKTYGHKSCGDWRGYKSQIWEGGHRVPFLVRWPGHVAEGAVSDELVCLTDFFATVAAVLGKPLPAGAAPDSENILPALLGQPDRKPAREALVHHDFAGRFAIRQGDWKYVAPANSTRRRAADGQAAQLYNLRSDPVEQRDAIAEQPQVAKRLASLLKDYQQRGDSHGAKRASD